MNKIEQVKLSFIDNIHDHNITNKKPISEIVDEIKQSSYKNLVDDLRDTHNQDLKKRLPLFCPAIKLQGTRKLEEYNDYQTTGIVQFDIDNITFEDAKKYKILIQAIPECLYAFISPNMGLKFAVMSDFIRLDKADILKEEFKYVYLKTKKYISQFINADFDNTASSISQLCYLSYDPDIYFNNDPSVFNISDDATAYVVSQNQKEELKEIEEAQVTNVDDNHVIEALTFIPPDLDYKSRRDINFAVIDALGEGAKNILYNHWIVDDSSKLKKDLKDQIKAFKTFSSGITVATLFHKAKKHGYEKSHQQNCKSHETNLHPTHDEKRYSQEEAEKHLQTSILNFFESKQSRLINYEAGAGKTEKVISTILERLEKNRFEKIALFVPNHALADEMRERIKSQIHKNASEAKSFKQKRTAQTSISVAHIKGKSRQENDKAPLCQHPINLNRETHDPYLVELFQQKPREFCMACPLNEGCQYIEQFNNPLTNIRIYTHNQLFNRHSTFDAGIGAITDESKVYDYLNQKDSDRKWKPNYIIVDEDIIKTALDDDSLIEITTYEDCSKAGSAGDVLKSIIYDVERGVSLTETALKYCDEIIEESAKQDIAKTSWSEKNYIDFNDISNLQAMTLTYKNKKNNAPPYFNILRELKKYVLWLKQQEDTKNCSYNRLWVADGCIHFAKRRYIVSSYKNIPVLALDASANELITKIFYGKDMSFESIKVDYQSSVFVAQFENCSFSKKQMNEESLRDKIKNYIKQKSENKNFGIITYKNLPIQKDFAKNFANEVGAEQHGYFGNIRGLDGFSKLDVLFVIGRQLIRPDDLTIKYRQLYGCMSPYKNSISSERFAKKMVFRMSDEKHKYIYNMRHFDERFSSLHDFYNSAETYQAAHRLRLIHGNQKKELYILTSDVLDITVDELVNTRKELGYVRTITNDRILKIVDTIKKYGYLLNKNGEIVYKAEINASHIANLRKGNDFEKRILRESNNIQLLKVKGKANRRQVEREIFIQENANISDEEFTKIMNFSEILSIEDITEKYLI